MYIQLLVTGLWLNADLQHPQQIQDSIKRLEEDNLGRKLIYGDGKKRPPLRICRWQQLHSEQGLVSEIPPNTECAPDLLDIALHTTDVENLNVENYRKLFDGTIDRLHVCTSCQPHIVISQNAQANTTQVRSVWGLLVLSLAQFGSRSNESYFRALDDMKEIRNLVGPVQLYFEGLSEPVELQKTRTALALIINIAGLVLIATWLAIRAHRKVLDYFAYSGALSPLVAATGRSTFYSALWLLTLARVGAFLLASIPIVALGLWELLDHKDMAALWDRRSLVLVLWLPALVLSFATATLVASVAELKQRHNMLSFMYRYAPLIAAGLGLFVWAASFLADSSTAALVRLCITSLPIIGMGPVLVAPVIPPPAGALATHALLTLLICVVVLRHNARWFAAHLEEL